MSVAESNVISKQARMNRRYFDIGHHGTLSRQFEFDARREKSPKTGAGIDDGLFLICKLSHDKAFVALLCHIYDGNELVVHEILRLILKV